jgi:hypothetical protein
MKTVLVIASHYVSVDMEAALGDMKRGVRGRHRAPTATRKTNNAS